jgi:hypothetical protein
MMAEIHHSEVFTGACETYIAHVKMRYLRRTVQAGSKSKYERQSS